MKRHGAEAPIHAAMHPDAMLDKGVQQRFCLLRSMMNYDRKSPHLVTRSMRMAITGCFSTAIASI